MNLGQSFSFVDSTGFDFQQLATVEGPAAAGALNIDSAGALAVDILMKCTRLQKEGDPLPTPEL
jgi:hypothetical protein